MQRSRGFGYPRIPGINGERHSTLRNLKLESPDAAPTLPTRDRLLAQAEREAEIIVSAVRVSVALVIVFALLSSLWFLEAPPPDIVKQQIHAAAIVLSSYFFLGVAALTISVMGRLKRWMPWFFASIDVLLVAGNCWWTLVNTDLPQSYLFTAPAVWAAPVVFAFASLRYRPGLQAYMVVIVIMACIVLIWGLDLPGADTTILPSVFEDPPNVIRTAMLGLCGGILVLGAYRRRVLLDRAVKEAEERNILARFMPAQIAPMIADQRRQDLRRGWRAEVGIVLVDIRGFTQLSESLSPEALSRFISAFRQHVMQAADKHGGVVDKFIGDGALVIFGVPETAENDASNALAFGADLLRRVAAWHPDEGPRVRIGLGGHYGEVFAGAVGDANRLEFTVLGDAVNVASRLEELTKTVPHGFVVSKPLLDAAIPDAQGDQAMWVPLTSIALRGREAGIEAFGLHQRQI